MSREQWGQCTTLNWRASCGDSSLQMYLAISITYSLSTPVAGYWCLEDFKATQTIRLHGRGGVCPMMTVVNSTGKTATINLHYKTLVTTIVTTIVTTRWKLRSTALRAVRSTAVREDVTWTEDKSLRFTVHIDRKVRFKHTIKLIVDGFLIQIVNFTDSGLNTINLS